jgi:hypothetical protein
MNPSNCSSPWANDEILVFGDVPSCNLPIPAYLVLLVLATLNRFKIAIFHVSAWRKRETLRKRNHSALNPSRAQLPIVPCLSLIVAISQALFLVLTAANIISSRDGSSTFLFSVIFLSIMLIAQLYAFKLVRLGKKLAPLNHHMESSNSNEGEKTSLASFDKLQLFLIWIWWFGAGVMVIAPFFVYYYQPLPNVDAFRALIIANVFMNASNIILQAHQMTRVIKVVKAQSRRTAAIVSAGSPTAMQVSKVVTRLQKLRVLYVFLCFFYCSILIANAVTLNFFWWMYVLNVGMEQLYLEAFSNTLTHKKDQTRKVDESATMTAPRNKPT